MPKFPTIQEAHGAPPIPPAEPLDVAPLDVGPTDNALNFGTTRIKASGEAVDGEDLVNLATLLKVNPLALPVPENAVEPLVLAHDPSTGTYYWWNWNLTAFPPPQLPPSEVYDVHAWYDASDASKVTIVAPNRVSALAPVVGTLPFTQATVGARPEYHEGSWNGLNAIRFFPANIHHMSTSAVGWFSNSGIATIFIVGARRSNQVNNHLLSMGVPNAELHVVWPTDTSFSVNRSAASAACSVTVPAFTAPQILMAQFTIQSPSATLRINAGEEEITDASVTASSANNPVTLGRNTGGSAQYGFVDFCEMIVFQSALPIERVYRIEGYLMHKWGLAAKLPADHPFKDAPPLDPIPLP